MIGRALGVAWLSICAACGEPPSGPPPGEQVKLEGGVAARVGGEVVAVETVRRIAEAQAVEPSRAQALALSDAVFAAEARARGLDVAPATAQRIDAALAAALVREFAREARAAGPPTDEELAAATARHYYVLDRPEAFVTVHAVARVPEKADDATWTRATELAGRIRAAVQPAADMARLSPPADDPAQDAAAKRFLELAAAVDAGGIEVRAEPLPPIARDGLSVEPDGRSGFDATYVGAATALERRGDLSPVTRSPFGAHVILLVSRLPERRLPPAERRALLADEIYDQRARALREAALAPVASSHPVEIERSADALLQMVSTR